MKKKRLQDTSPNITINGQRLDHIQFTSPKKATGDKVTWGYPSSEFRLTRNGNHLQIGMPSRVALELYRIGILPQDTDVSVRVQIDKNRAEDFLVTELVYHYQPYNTSVEVTFTLTLVPSDSETTNPPSQFSPFSKIAPNGVTVSDVYHFLDEFGEVVALPPAVRKIATFLTQLIDEATKAFPSECHKTSVGCRTKGCDGRICTHLTSQFDEILWHCPQCETSGVLSNWQGTRWNQLTQDKLLP